MKHSTLTRALCVMVLAACVVSAHAVQLITPKEAKQPAANGTLNTRGIARGPGIRITSPDPALLEVKSPFDLKVQFESRGGNKIDPAAVKVTYLKANAIDLTPRLKSSITESGIELEKAEVPLGEHAIKITVKDVDGRESNTVVNLNVIK